MSFKTFDYEWGNLSYSVSFASVHIPHLRTMSEHLSCTILDDRFGSADRPWDCSAKEKSGSFLVNQDLPVK